MIEILHQLDMAEVAMKIFKLKLYDNKKKTRKP